MKILVTGNKGYIGAVLTKILTEKDYWVRGYDTNYYDSCSIGDVLTPPDQINKDIRDVEPGDLVGIDIVVHLAALSNDPLGELQSELTYDINMKATVRLAELAKRAKVKRFIYSSSQSMYGISNSDQELGEDAAKAPLTAYARTKWLAEQNLLRLSDEYFHVVCFRPSTVFGVSPMLRCDIVFNNLVACAYTTGKIEIKSDGTPWRPVVHIKDVCQAYLAGIEAPARLVSRQSFNVGIPNGNFTVRDLAEAAQRAVPNSQLILTGENPDNRTYKVSFSKILNQLKEYYRPEWGLNDGAHELVKFFKKIKFTEEDFRKKCNRLLAIRESVLNGKLDNNLRWRH